MILPMPLYTPEDLLLYLYKETSDQQAAEIEAALKEDSSLRDKLKSLELSIHHMDSILLESPRTEVVLNVLNYARKSMVQTA
jgi:hypothetical protein